MQEKKISDSMPEKNHPKITVDGKEYFVVGCGKCGKAGQWNIGASADGKKMIAKCEWCGAIRELPPVVLKRTPDARPIDMRMLA